MHEPAAIIEAYGLHRHFPVASRGERHAPAAARILRAVRGIDMTLRAGETVAVVGESGCGKSTLARMLLGLDRPSDGRVNIGGTDVARLGRRDIARTVQPIFQDPSVSLNPAKTVEQIVSLPLRALAIGSRASRREHVHAMLELVGLPGEFSGRQPRQLSGGQRQRVAIARALVAEPAALICDEPTSALDVSIQAQILNLLQDVRERQNLAYLVISHNLAVVDRLAERIVVMYFGRIVEEGPTREVLRQPRHPYTRMLRLAVLEPKPGHQLDDFRDLGLPPNPLSLPVGCPFRPRCAFATEICAQSEPQLTSSSSGRAAACHHPLASEASIPTEPPKDPQ